MKSIIFHHNWVMEAVSWKRVWVSLLTVLTPYLLTKNRVIWFIWLLSYATLELLYQVMENLSMTSSSAQFSVLLGWHLSQAPCHMSMVFEILSCLSGCLVHLAFLVLHRILLFRFLVSFPPSSRLVNIRALTLKWFSLSLNLHSPVKRDWF